MNIFFSPGVHKVKWESMRKDLHGCEGHQFRRLVLVSELVSLSALSSHHLPVATRSPCCHPGEKWKCIQQREWGLAVLRGTVTSSRYMTTGDGIGSEGCGWAVCLETTLGFRLVYTEFLTNLLHPGVGQESCVPHVWQHEVQ